MAEIGGCSLWPRERGRSLAAAAMLIGGEHRRRPGSGAQERTEVTAKKANIEANKRVSLSCLRQHALALAPRRRTQTIHPTSLCSRVPPR